VKILELIINPSIKFMIIKLMMVIKELLIIII